MAHKAKPKSKPCLTQLTKINPKIKATQKKVKPTVKRATTTTTMNENVNKNTLLCSYTEPIIQVVNLPLTKKSSEPPQNPRPNENETAKVPLLIVHKRGKMDVNTDIIGAKALTKWKKSSGRSKSWANCQRKRLSQGDLELLIGSQTRSVVFGWRFSSAVTPSLFLCSQGFSVNSDLTQKRSSKPRISGYLVVDYGREMASQEDCPERGRVSRQGNEDQATCYWGFLRLTISRGIVSLTREAYLTVINLPTPDKEPGRGKHLNTLETTGLPVLRLLRNDSHADVYLVRNLNVPFNLYHAHAFLNIGSSGNWAIFAKRKMKHLRGSCDFVFETLQGGRTIIVMELESKAEEFRLKITQNDFPPLPSTDLKSAKISPKKNIRRLSYATIVQRKRPSNRPLDSNHRAYQAWNDRNSNRKKIAEIKLESAPSLKSQVRQLESEVEDFTGWVTVDRKRAPSIAHRSRVSNLSKLVLKDHFIQRTFS